MYTCITDLQYIEGISSFTSIETSKLFITQASNLKADQSWPIQCRKYVIVYEQYT